MKNTNLIPFTLTAIVLLAGCSGKSGLEKELSEILQENPQILADAIKKNPVEIMEAMQAAAIGARSEMAKKRAQEKTKYYDEPLTPNIRKDEAIRGTKNAPLVLVEYSDFECGYCARGFNTVMKLMDKYKGKIQFIYKHLPLSFHKQAMISSQYYEAIRLQDENKAFKFHDKIFNKQSQLKKGEPFLKKIG
ncbi:MAG: thioredoxin domain-containing protein, partial [Halobacteriovoraceae bacterium]|nr:thioredoxin domain-containing protein [Halobacteriovoraceae bacterium]